MLYFKVLIQVCSKAQKFKMFLFFRKNADDTALSGVDLRPPAVLRREPVPEDEREESQVALPRLQQGRAVRQPPARRVL